MKKKEWSDIQTPGSKHMSYQMYNPLTPNLPIHVPPVKQQCAHDLLPLVQTCIPTPQLDSAILYNCVIMFYCVIYINRSMQEKMTWAEVAMTTARQLDMLVGEWHVVSLVLLSNKTKNLYKPELWTLPLLIMEAYMEYLLVLC